MLLSLFRGILMESTGIALVHQYNGLVISSKIPKNGASDEPLSVF